MKRIRRSLFLLILVVILVACETSIRDEINTDDALTKRTLRILLLAQPPSRVKDIKLYRNIRQFEEERWDVDVEFHVACFLWFWIHTVVVR